MIKPGEMLKDVYRGTVSKIRDAFPETMIPSSFGFGVGMFLS